MSQTIRLAEAAPSPVAFERYRPASELTCMPDVAHAHLDFHWLAFVSPLDKPVFPLRTECELWRWHAGEWRSVFVPGHAIHAGRVARPWLAVL